MSLHVIKAWLEDGPCDYFVVSAETPMQALGLLMEYFEEETNFELTSLDEAYDGVALLSSMDNRSFE